LKRGYETSGGGLPRHGDKNIGFGTRKVEANVSASPSASHHVQDGDESERANEKWKNNGKVQERVVEDVTELESKENMDHG
jgi:hypothetical protein